uniref:Uncharacterized protein n=1 Tax=Rhizophagus irregularis (strain DAOM 181602 / DAOM 197198 / MUCL 43194) TaxID=747089 RepID=U9TI40_RHIID
MQQIGKILGYSSNINLLANCIALTPSGTTEEKCYRPISLRIFFISFAIKRPLFNT